MNNIKKIQNLLSRRQKIQLGILAFLLIIGMLFEMLGLGILIPALGIMLKPEIGASYPVIKDFLSFFKATTKEQFIIVGMLVLVLVYLVKAVFLVYLTWRQSKFSAELSADLSRRLFHGYLLQPYTFHLQRNSAELLRNIQTEVGLFLTVSQNFITISIELSAAIGISAVLFFIEPVGAIVVSVFMLLSGILFYWVTKSILLTWGQERQYHDGKSNQHLMQGLNGVKDVKILGRESTFLKEFATHNEAKARISTKQNTLLLIPRFYLELLAVVGLTGLIILMIYQNKPFELIIPSVSVFVAAAFRMIPSVNRVMSSLQYVRFAQPVIELLYNEIQSFDNNKARTELTDKLSFTSNIVVDQLHFSYPLTSTQALREVSITIKKGQSVGLIGPSGSGKSTLVDVILGLLQPSSGRILIDGVDVSENVRSWQRLIGYVPQSIYLSDDTLEKNIAFGIPVEEIDLNAVHRAIKAAQLDQLVSSLPDGLNTFVGERGVRLSGGQRQRIGIARALYHNPQVLVLDEATSALDGSTEIDVMEAVNELKGMKTIIIVAHRLSTVKNCDLLFKLEAGKVIASGAPENVLVMHGSSSIS